ncbi:MAG: DUF134 domain-containing protein [Candidatus Micrarchaeota archaeon]
MVRPKKCRMVDAEPDADYFKPRGVMLHELEEVELSVEELEAIRLKDYKRLDQMKVAKKMGISQPSLHRLLSSARHKVAEALVDGKAIKIHGGSYSVRRTR